MPDEPTTPTTPTTETTETTETPVVEEQPTTEKSTETPAEGEENVDKETPPGEGDDDDSKLSHEDALKALTKVRKEAASSRTRLREAEEKLKDAKTPEEFEAAKAEIVKANADDARALLVENVAVKAGLPDELASALKGETREELEAHAKVLAKFVPQNNEPSDDPDLGGGLEPGTNSEGFDAKAEAQKMRRQRHRGGR